MARTKDEIKKEMVDAFMSDATLQQSYGFDPTKSFAEQFSKVSIENIIFSIVSTAIWVLECLFDKHQEEVSETISKRAHTLAWYREKALAFQYGQDLRDDVAEYDNTGLTDEQIEAKKIIAKCSCTETNSVFPTILVKAVKESGKLSAQEKAAFGAYMKEIADAGIKLNVQSENPDKVGFLINIYYDPLTIYADGSDNSGVENIVSKYISDFLENLPYNGYLYPNMLESYLMTCQGVKVANVIKIMRSISIGSTYEAPTDETKEVVTPSSGAFVFDNTIDQSLDIVFKPFN